MNNILKKINNKNQYKPLLFAFICLMLTCCTNNQKSWQKKEDFIVKRSPSYNKFIAQGNMSKKENEMTPQEMRTKSRIKRELVGSKSIADRKVDNSKINQKISKQKNIIQQKKYTSIQTQQQKSSQYHNISANNIPSQEYIEYKDPSILPQKQNIITHQRINTPHNQSNKNNSHSKSKTQKQIKNKTKNSKSIANRTKNTSNKINMSTSSQNNNTSKIKQQNNSINLKRYISESELDDM